MWMLKSRVTWLSLGDKNTSFFHRSTLIRRRNNRITKLLKNDGTWIINPSDIIHEINYYLSNIHAHITLVSPPYQSYIDLIPKLNQEDQNTLTAFPDLIEIKRVVFNLHPYKGPGDDGLHAIFYQRNWDAIKGKLSNEIYNIFLT